MEINLLSKLASETTAFLAPLLPYLLKIGDEASKEAGKKFGNAIWNKAKSIWELLNYRIELRPSAIEAVKDVAADVQDSDAQEALRLQLKKILEEDPSLVDLLSQDISEKTVQRVIAKNSRIEDVAQVASGEGAVLQETKATDNSVVKGVKQIKEIKSMD